MTNATLKHRIKITAWVVGGTLAFLFAFGLGAAGGETPKTIIKTQTQIETVIKKQPPKIVYRTPADCIIALDLAGDAIGKSGDVFGVLSRTSDETQLIAAATELTAWFDSHEDEMGLAATSCRAQR
jgi:hypothetical protein